MRRDATANCALLLLPEAVAYIGGGLKWSVSRRPIRLGGFSEGLGTAQIALRSQPARRRVTYATAKPVRSTRNRSLASAAMRDQERSHRSVHECRVAAKRGAAWTRWSSRKTRASSPSGTPLFSLQRERWP